MRENPRPTRHLEQLETAQLGKLAPGSVSGPAWDLVALPGPPGGGAPATGVPDAAEADAVAHRFAPAAPVAPAVLVAAPVPPEPAAAPAEPVTPPAAPSAGVHRWTMVAVGCGVLAAFALGIGGLTMLWADRPETDTTGPVERTALDLPLIPADGSQDASTGEGREAGPRDADDTEAGEPREDGTDASLLGDGTASSGGGPDQGSEGAPGEGTSTGGSGGSGSDPGSGAGGGTGPGGGGTTPTDGPPPPTSDPTTDPTEEPTPKPTPTASDEPTPEPTPSPTVSPTPTPTGAPVSPNVGG